MGHAGGIGSTRQNDVPTRIPTIDLAHKEPPPLPPAVVVTLPLGRSAPAPPRAYTLPRTSCSHLFNAHPGGHLCGQLFLRDVGEPPETDQLGLYRVPSEPDKCAVMAAASTRREGRPTGVGRLIRKARRL